MLLKRLFSQVLLSVFLRNFDNIIVVLLHLFAYGAYEFVFVAYIFYYFLCLYHWCGTSFRLVLQCSQLPGKTRFRNDILCVEWDIKPYTLTHLGWY